MADEEEGQRRANNVTVALVAKTGVIICPIWTQTLFTFFTEGRFPNTADGQHWNVLAPSHLVEVGLVGLPHPEATDLPVTACSLSSAQVNQVKGRRQLPARRVFVCKNVMAGHSHSCNRCGQEAQSRAHLAAAPTLLASYVVVNRSARVSVDNSPATYPDFAIFITLVQN